MLIERSLHTKTFPKNKRLKSATAIQALFRHRFFIKEGAFRLSYLKSDKPLQSTFLSIVVVPKRRFSKATDRNRIKRLMREAIRQHQFILADYLSKKDERLLIGLHYLGKEIPRFDNVSRSCEQLFKKYILQDENN